MKSEEQHERKFVANERMQWYNGNHNGMPWPATHPAPNAIQKAICRTRSRKIEERNNGRNLVQ
jgi:hypothetical protein